MRDQRLGSLGVVAVAAIGLVAGACQAAPPVGEQPSASASPGAPPAPRPAPDDDLVGVLDRPAPGWDLPRWINSPPLALDALRGKVVLVRWFMSPACPLCSATAPSLNLLDERYRDRGLVVIGMYHHKDDGPLDPAKVEDHVRRFGFRFPVAIDEDWRTLRRWWLGDGTTERSFTSVSFLLDREGIVRHVHIGGAYAPGSPDFETMAGRIEALLAAPPR